jgi:glycosyltransferase involved in cell wall biosynthesis
MHICIVSQGYPSKGHPYFTFVEQLSLALADLGIQITIISPQSVTNSLFRKIPLAPKYSKILIKSGIIVEIYRPWCFSLGNIGGFLKHLYSDSFERAVYNTFINLKTKPDVCYGHFWHIGYNAYRAAKKYDIPLFIASGEAEIELHKNYSIESLTEFTNYVRGVICVSTKNKKESIDNGLTSENKCIILPNSIDSDLFYKKDKSTLRRQFGYKDDDFIVAFVGGFVHRKGTLRISEAITSLNDESIKSIFIGSTLSSDRCIPNCNGILFMGKVDHDKIGDYLNCADVFLMPTLQEGCCNANIEAMACGLPIISSDLSFNYDILDSSYSLLIDPMNIQQIADSIKYIKDNPEIKKQMSVAALKASKKFELNKRAEGILQFIEKRI